MAFVLGTISYLIASLKRHVPSDERVFGDGVFKSGDVIKYDVTGGGGGVGILLREGLIDGGSCP